MTLPGSFWWGAGVSAVGGGGLAPGSDLAAWVDEERLDRPGPGIGLGANHLGTWAEHGLTDLRITLDWARLEPTQGSLDQAEVEGLRLALASARDVGESGLRVWGCLHDGPLPGWFAHDERGFVDERSRRYHWARHVEQVGELFGDLVHGWVPVHEPGRWAYRGSLVGTRPPGRTGEEHFAEALEAIHLATVEAALRLRGGGQPVATSEWVVPVFPARLEPDAPPTPDAEAMASTVDETLWATWRRLLDEETLAVPHRAAVEVPGARGAFDVVGFTYRHAWAVRGDGALLPYPQDLPTGDDGHVPWLEGLELSVHRVAEAFPDHPLLVTGIGIATTDEARREEHLRDALAVAQRSVDDGIDLRGLWWDEAATARRGLFDPDGSPRAAASLLAAVAADGDVPT